ncbi:uncharacterized protein JCM6883_000489 [Sporobolomyces salmoneus]|uniref:uncharacterized protein n=1 Tax=Sporobolomyces salmoneus TaxID=183962 RepID=UPI00316FE4CC
MLSLITIVVALLGLIASALGGSPYSQTPNWGLGYSLNRPLPGGREIGYHGLDPATGDNYLLYGVEGAKDAKQYDFKKRGFAQLLAVDLDFYAEFSFKHFQIFEYSKSREINFTASAVDVSADEANRVAKDTRAGVDSPYLDANTKAQLDAAGADGKAVDADHKSGNIREKLTLTAKRYDELKFRLKTKVEIDDLLHQKRLKGEKARFYGHLDGVH